MSPGRAGLLDLVASDLVGYQRADLGDGRARFVPRKGGLPLEVDQRVERRFVGRTTIARFHSIHPDNGLSGSLRVAHTGRRRRTGVEVRVVDGSVGELARQLEVDERFVDSVLPLDFTRFEIASGRDQWLSTIELMGATLVAIALPPIRSYVRLFPDQLAALRETVEAMDRVIASFGRCRQ